MHSFIMKIKMKYISLPTEVKASFWFMVCAFFQRGISVITTPIFTRLMSTAEYGEFSVFYSWYSIISVFLTLNLFFGVYVRGMVVYDEEKNQFTSSMQGLMLTLTMIWLVIYCLFNDLFNDILNLDTFQMISMIVIIWTNGVFNFWAAEQRVKLEYKRLVIISLITAALVPALQIILIIMMDDSVTARIIGLVVISVLFYPVLFAKHMFSGKKFFSKKFWKYALAFNIPLIPHYISQIILNSADRIMINEMIGADEAGIYSLAYSVSQIMTIFNTALMQAIEPWLYRKIKNREINQIRKVAYPAFIIVAVINILLIALAPEVVAIFAPKQYSNAIWIIPPVAMSVFFMFAYTFFAVFEFYYKKTQYIAIATMIGAIVNIILNYVCIYAYGYYAAGYTTLICYMFYAIFHYLFMHKLVKENFPGEAPYDPKVLLLTSMFFLAAGFGLLFMYENNFIRYMLVLVLSVAGVMNYKKISSLYFKVIKNETA